MKRLFTILICTVLIVALTGTFFWLVYSDSTIVPEQVKNAVKVFINDVRLTFKSIGDDFRLFFHLTEPTTIPTAAPEPATEPVTELTVSGTVTADEIPAYTGSPYTVINDNEPFFAETEFELYAQTGYEYYSSLDALGRCGVTISFVGKETMPTTDRGDISWIKPSGWKNKSYSFIDGEWVYNRCHLIGWQLTAENANARNLITGTRYMNVQGMLPFENMVADYVKETKQHVLYRVTPIFDGSNLVADGVLMEAYSYEDNGNGILFCVFCYNVQPGVVIDYSTGKNKAA